MGRKGEGVGIAMVFTAKVFSLVQDCGDSLGANGGKTFVYTSLFYSFQA